jgi:hypothetical protein
MIHLESLRLRLLPLTPIQSSNPFLLPASSNRGPRVYSPVMHSRDARIRDRVKAASALLRLYGNDSFKPPRLTYIIPEFPHACARAVDLGTPDQNPSTKDPDEKNTNQQLKSRESSQRPQAHDDDLRTPNIETTNTDPLSFDQIQQIKAVHQLCPDADLSQLPLASVSCACTTSTVAMTTPRTISAALPAINGYQSRPKPSLSILPAYR